MGNWVSATGDAAKKSREHAEEAAQAWKQAANDAASAQSQMRGAVGNLAEYALSQMGERMNFRLALAGNNAPAQNAIRLGQAQEYFQAARLYQQQGLGDLAQPALQRAAQEAQTVRSNLVRQGAPVGAIRQVNAVLEQIDQMRTAFLVRQIEEARREQELKNLELVNRLRVVEAAKLAADADVKKAENAKNLVDVLTKLGGVSTRVAQVFERIVGAGPNVGGGAVPQVAGALQNDFMALNGILGF
jgi:hypothetical protein